GPGWVRGRRPLRRSGGLPARPHQPRDGEDTPASESGDEPDPGGLLPPSVPRCRPYVRVCPCLPICPVRVSALAAAPASSACLPRLSCLPCLSLPAPACLDRAVRAGRRRGHEQR